MPYLCVVEQRGWALRATPIKTHGSVNDTSLRFITIHRLGLIAKPLCAATLTNESEIKDHVKKFLAKRFLYVGQLLKFLEP